MHNPPAPASSANSVPPVLSSVFTNAANGASSTSAGLTSPTTPFSQSVLPSKSLLSRQDSSSLESSMVGNAGIVGAHPAPLALQRNVQKNLQGVIRRLFESCYEVDAYHQVVGIAIEARNLEILREAILRASLEERKQTKKAAVSPTPGKSEELMEYVLDICMNVVQERGLRNEVCFSPFERDVQR